MGGYMRDSERVYRLTKLVSRLEAENRALKDKVKQETLDRPVRVNRWGVRVCEDCGGWLPDSCICDIEDESMDDDWLGDGWPL